MAARKRDALERMGSLGPRHRVAEVDALRDDGPQSLAAVAAGLDENEGLAIVTEGLLGYLPTDAVTGAWGRFADVLAAFPSGHYISDLHLGGVQTAPVRAFRVLLSAFVRGRVCLHFADAAAGETALRAAGFGVAEVRRAVDVRGGEGQVADPGVPGALLAHILEASTR